jgi:hypothetical protein
MIRNHVPGDENAAGEALRTLDELGAVRAAERLREHGFANVAAGRG